MITIRHPSPTEIMPINLPNPDPRWIWVAVSKGLILGYVACLAAHGVVMPIRVERLADDKNERAWLFLLLRHAARECLAAGWTTYLTCLSNKERPGKMLIDFTTRRNGRTGAMEGYIVGGHLKELF